MIASIAELFGVDVRDKKSGNKFFAFNQFNRNYQGVQETKTMQGDQSSSNYQLPPSGF